MVKAGTLHWGDFLVIDKQNLEYKRNTIAIELTK